LPSVWRDGEEELSLSTDSGILAQHLAALPIAAKMTIVTPMKINTQGPFRINTS